jgi:hypothetical protein
MRPAEQLYEAFMGIQPTGIFSTIRIDFPDFLGKILCAGVLAPDVLAEFSQLMKPEDFEEEYRGFTYQMVLSELLNDSIKRGYDRFELETNGIGTFPYGVGSDKPGKRVQLILNGNLGDQSIKSGQNLDVLVKGNVGDHVGIFGKNNRIYVTGTTGAFPMSQSEYCVLDAESIGSNQVMIKDGVVVSRRDAKRNFYNHKKWCEYLNEWAPLIGSTNFLLKNRFIVHGDMKHSGTKFLSAGKVKKPYVHIEYQEPSWIPK